MLLIFCTLSEERRWGWPPKGLAVVPCGRVELSVAATGDQWGSSD